MIKIVSAQLTKTHLTLVSETGKLYNIPQGRTDLPDLIEKCRTNLKGSGTYFEMPLDEIQGLGAVARAPLTPALKAIEEKSNKRIRFFSMVRSAVSKIFGLSPQTDGTFIRLDEEAVKATLSVEEQNEREELLTSPEEVQQKARIAEVMANATPLTQEDMDKGFPVGTHTVVAVTDEGVTVGVEALEAQLTQSKDLDGTAALLERLSRVTMDHTAHDVLSFLKRGDLPVTVNGDIIAYKRLRRHTKDKLKGYYDVHSRTVFQCVGDTVQMPASRVDRNRRQQCSVGLHIARRGYLKSFGGDALVICLIAPEDVIAVPHNTPDKVRVSRYKIVAEVTQQGFHALTNDRPLEKGKHDDDLNVISRLVAGWTPPTLATVTVNGSTESQVHRELVEAPEAEITPETVTEVTVLDTSKVVNADEEGIIRAELSQEAVVDLEKVATPSQAPVRMLKARELYNAWEANKTPENLKALQDFKRGTKASWETLGIPNPAPMKAQVVATPQVEKKPGKAKTPRQGMDELRPFRTKKKAEAALAIKKAAKKSWAALGVNEQEQALIEAWLK